MNYLVRLATSSDIPIVTKLQQEFINEHQKLYDSVFYALDAHAADEWSCWALKKLQEQELGLFVIVENNTLIGYSSGYIETRPPIYSLRKIGYVSNMYILPEYRGKGAGSKLHNALVQWFKDKDIVYIELSVDARAAATIATWTHLGYKEVGKKMRMKL